MNIGTIVWWDSGSKLIGQVVELGFSPGSTTPIHRVRQIDEVTGELAKCPDKRCRGRSLQCGLCGKWQSKPEALSIKRAGDFALAPKLMRQHFAAVQKQEKEKA